MILLPFTLKCNGLISDSSNHGVSVRRMTDAVIQTAVMREQAFFKQVLNINEFFHANVSDIASELTCKY